MSALRQALLNQVTAEDLAAITQAMVARAKEGDVAAAKLVFNNVLGKPQESVPAYRLDADEWQCWEGEAMRNGTGDS